MPCLVFGILFSFRVVSPLSEAPRPRNGRRGTGLGRGGLRGGLLSHSPQGSEGSSVRTAPTPAPSPLTAHPSKRSSHPATPPPRRPLTRVDPGPVFVAIFWASVSPYEEGSYGTAPPRALTCGGCCQGGSPPRCRSQIRHVRMPLQPHSRRTSGAATTAAAIAASWRPERRRGAAGAAGSCSPPAGREVREAASFRSSSTAGSRGAASRTPPAADVSVGFQEARTRPVAGAADRPARAAPSRHGPPLGAAAHAARASQERPAGEDPELGVRRAGGRRGPRGRGHTARHPGLGCRPVGKKGWDPCPLPARPHYRPVG